MPYCIVLTNRIVSAFCFLYTWEKQVPFCFVFFERYFPFVINLPPSIVNRHRYSKFKIITSSLDVIIIYLIFTSDSYSYDCYLLLNKLFVDIVHDVSLYINHSRQPEGIVEEHIGNILSLFVMLSYSVCISIMLMNMSPIYVYQILNLSVSCY
jgi:hypothetical protein